jgi:putative solute:sodium symporter small subunit
MAEVMRRRPYWRQTKLLMLSSLTPPLVLIGGLAFWVARAGTATLAGAPIGFLLAVHGVVIVSIAAVARFAAKQERIDRSHGAYEDS